jgi:hypothetical protein
MRPIMLGHICPGGTLMKVAWHEVPGGRPTRWDLPEGGLIVPLVPKIFCVEVYPVCFDKRQILLLECSGPMVFQLVFNVMDSLW